MDIDQAYVISLYLSVRFPPQLIHVDHPNISNKHRIKSGVVERGGIRELTRFPSEPTGYTAALPVADESSKWQGGALFSHMRCE